MRDDFVRELRKQTGNKLRADIGVTPARLSPLPTTHSCKEQAGEKRDVLRKREKNHLLQTSRASEYLVVLRTVHCSFVQSSAVRLQCSLWWHLVTVLVRQIEQITKKKTNARGNKMRKKETPFSRTILLSIEWVCLGTSSLEKKRSCLDSPLKDENLRTRG